MGSRYTNPSRCAIWRDDGSRFGDQRRARVAARGRPVSIELELRRSGLDDANYSNGAVSTKGS